MRMILNDQDFLNAARELLTPPLLVPSGHVLQEGLFSSSQFSSWLGLRLEEIIKSFSGWEKTQPILLGSWARNEICLKSDIDILFCGEEEVVVALVARLNEQGYKLRYRMPKDFSDWTINVEAFDILALLKAKPLTAYAAKLLMEQQKIILQKRKHYGKILLQAIKAERSQRAERFDSITNFLEPNIKYGPGGLRDLEQGLQIYELFADKIPHPFHALNVLKYYKSYWLSIRQKLHLEGLGDILINTAQFDISNWLGFKNQKEFMRDFQSGLSRVNFYSEWILEVALASPQKLKKSQEVQFKRAPDLVNQILLEPDTLMQKRVREKMDHFFTKSNHQQTAKLRGTLLEKILSPKASDSSLVAVFRSRLIDKLVPEINRLVGYVQHDQYHRFTADTHIMQACREFKRVYQHSSELGALQIFHKKMKDYDWKVLRWACLYHDLAKGLESEDHSGVGVSIVQKDFKSYGFTKNFTEDVSWLVQNHLEMSQAAFRKNPKSLKVWEDLKNKQVEGQNLYRLVIFTVIDIRATNPEALNDWKLRLLKELTLNLESKSAQNYFEFSKERKKNQLKLPIEVYEELDPLLLESVSSKKIVQDLLKAEKAQENLKPLIIKNKKSDYWIRFHHKKDKQGLLADYVLQLYSLGLGIRHASIQTFPHVGVYDWFQVTSTKKLATLMKMLDFSQTETKSIPPVKFDNIDIVTADEKEWILSFKGRDQSGLLAAAATALSENGINVRAAKVHTWGQQIEDVFTVKPQGDLQSLVAKLREQFLS